MLILESLQEDVPIQKKKKEMSSSKRKKEPRASWPKKENVAVPILWPSFDVLVSIFAPSIPRRGNYIMRKRRIKQT